MRFIFWTATLCSVALLLPSCAANTGGTGSTAPTITLTDFRAQNIERVRDGVLGLMGGDSAGLAGKEYIRAFEEDLAMRIPTQAAMPARTEQAPASNANPEWWWGDYAMWEEARRISAEKDRANNSISPDILELKRFLDGRKTEAIGDLRTHNAAFVAGGGRASAKLGLAASYIAIFCANEPGDLETITKLVEPLLTELTKK
jgi:hypothetical protein